MGKDSLETGRERRLMDFGWKFHLGDIPMPISVGHSQAYGTGWSKAGQFQGPALPGYDDSGWRTVDLPHDWVVEQPFDPKASSSRGYRWGDAAWYRRTFFLSSAEGQGRLFLEFEGIFRDATVYLNGHRLGHEPGGYIGQLYDITDQALYNDDNVLAVHVDARENEGWWYEGGGIYRHVWLTRTAAIHFEPYTIFASADLAADHRYADLRVRGSVANFTEVDFHGEIVVALLDAGDTTKAQIRSALSVPAGGAAVFDQTVGVPEPHLWSTDSPYLYRVRCTVMHDGRPVDEWEEPFGIRSIRFDADRGFFLNGNPLKILGVSNHEDHAGVGMAVPDRLFEYRIRRMKEMGANAWRCAHGPPAPAFLDACDRLGMLVMDETRIMNSSDEGRHQLEFIIRRDRNHPSVIMWSLGNEEKLQGSDAGARIIRTMKRWTRQLDPTRPVTLAMSGGWCEPVAPLLDVMGCNYNHLVYDEFHAKFPHLPMIVSENFMGSFATRGEYVNDRPRGYASSYDKFPTRPGCTADEMWGRVADRPFLAGTFPWTGFDYRGEPGPHDWPAVSSNFGIVDTCGFPKDIFHYYRAAWSVDPVLHLFPHWNWPRSQGAVVPVWCYTNCEEVELVLNGQPLGRRAKKGHGHIEWDVPYAPGTLVARGFRKGAPVVETEIRTTGPAAAIRLSVETPVLHAGGEDTAVIRVQVVDADGLVVPEAEHQVKFIVEGAATFLGTGNGDPSSHEPDHVPLRRVFHGLAQLLLRSTRMAGDITVTAQAAGLTEARLQLKSEQRPQCPQLPAVDAGERVDLMKAGVALALTGWTEPPAGWNGESTPGGGWKAQRLAGKTTLANAVLLRIQFQVPASMPVTGLEADLGAIHDYDQTWLNGVRLGSCDPTNTEPSMGHRTRRRYAIPDGLLRPGAGNVLAIRAWNRKPEGKTIVEGPMVIRRVVV